MSQAPEVDDEKEGGIPLETLSDVRRAMARCLRQLRTHKIEIKLGNALLFGYTQLAHLMQDARDTKYQKRLNVLWQAHEKAAPQLPAEPPETH